MLNGNIERIRGLAIIGVLCYHANLPMDSGFLGVDVFFVLSGFLVYKGIIKDCNSRSISVRRFIRKRLFRIFPTLSLTVLLVSLFSILLLSPLGEIQSNSKGLLASLTFFSNYFFALTTGSYFDDYASSLPSLHLWSLAVEFQIWFVFVIVARILQKSVTGVKFHFFFFLNLLNILIIIRYLELNLFDVGGSTSFGFYSTSLRGLELLLGAVAYMLFEVSDLKNKFWSVWLRNFLLFVIFISFFSPAIFSDPLRFLVITLSALYLIVCPESHSSPQPFGLSRVGNFAFTLYLLHWPVIVFCQKLQLSMIWAGVFCLALLPLFRFVENHFIKFGSKELRYQSTAIKNVILLTPLVIFAFAALPGYLAKGGGFDMLVKEIYLGKKRSGDECHTYMKAPQINTCRITPNSIDLRIDYFLIGDSHAASYTDSLIEYSLKNNKNSFISTHSGCPVYSLDLLRDDIKFDCIRYHKHILKHIQNLNPSHIIMATRVPNYLNSLPRVAGETSEISTSCLVNESKERTCGPSQETILMYSEARAEFLSAIPKRSAVLEIVGSLEFNKNFEDCTSLFSINLNCFKLSATDHSKRNSWINQVSSPVQFNINSYRIDLTSFFCSHNLCSAFKNSNLYYYDSHHLNTWGAKKVFYEVLVPLLK